MHLRYYYIYIINCTLILIATVSVVRSLGKQTKLEENGNPPSAFKGDAPTTPTLFRRKWMWSWSWSWPQNNNSSQTNNSLTIFDENDANDTATPTKGPVCSKPTQTLYNGTCFDLLQQLPCAEGEWLVEPENSEGHGKCISKRNCTGFNSGWHEKLGKCVEIRSDQDCPKGMRVYVYKTGAIDCDCKEGFIYYPKDGKCYEAYRQGPCGNGEILTLPSSTCNGNGPSCTKNPCLTDGFYCTNLNSCESPQRKLYWSIRGPQQGRRVPSKSCAKLGTPCNTTEEGGIFVISPETSKPHCQSPTEFYNSDGAKPMTRIIGNVPVLRCAPGSRRDILGNCRTPTVIDFS